MSNFLQIKSIRRAAPLRNAARIISIMILTLLWPARGEAQTSPGSLDVSNLSFTESDNSVTLTCSDQGTWTYKGGGNSSETPFNGTLTGTQANGKVFEIVSNKNVARGDTANYPKLILDNLNYTSDGAVFYAYLTSPVYIQTNGASELISNGAVGGGYKHTVISNYSTSLVINGGSNGLEIQKEAAYDYDLISGIYISNSDANIILQGKITITAHNTGQSSSAAIYVTNGSTLSYGESANIQCMAQSGFVKYGTISSPFLEWTFADAPARVSNQKLEIRDASGQSLRPAVEFTTDGKAKSFTVSATKNTGYTLWLGDMQTTGYKQLIDAEGTTVFKATDDKLFSFSGMKTLPSNWSEYGREAKVGPTGADVSVSDNTHYTVHTSAGLAWIAWVTNGEKNNTDEAGKYYPAQACFKGCTVTLANDIALTTPIAGVASDFQNNWPTIGNAYRKAFKGTFDGGSHTVSDLSITTTLDLSHGLFGYIENAVIKNLRVKGNIEGESTSTDQISVGGIVGRVNGTSTIIAGCANVVKINVKNQGKLYAGGIIGYADLGCAIYSCWNEADVSGECSDNFWMGGIAGYNFESRISNCYSTGHVSGKGKSNEDVSCLSGGIIGFMGSGRVSNCFATGSVSATNLQAGKDAFAGGVIGYHKNQLVEHCFALNTGNGIQISATPGSGGTSHASRVVGKTNTGHLIFDTYASTQVTLISPAPPTPDSYTKKLQGTDLYRDEVADIIASWAGGDNNQAFTAVGTDAGGKLPQLKAIDGFGTDGLPATYQNSVMAHQPSLITSDYLELPSALVLGSNEIHPITLSCSNNRWSFKRGSAAASRFTGTVEMEQGVNSSNASFTVSTATGNPTLTFENVTLNMAGKTPLTVNEGSELTLHTTGTAPSTFVSVRSTTLVNEGTLTLTGKGLSIENEDASYPRYCLVNSGSFTVTDPTQTSVTFHGATHAISNTGTLGNTWMEWQFLQREANDKIAFAAIDDANQLPVPLSLKNNAYAGIVTPGKTYYLWKVTDNNGEVRTLQKGLEGSKLLYRFPAPAGQGVAVYTKVEDLKTIEIANEQDFTAQGCLNQNVIVKAGGVLTVDTASAIVLNLKLEEGGQVVTTNALKVDETFSTTRELGNKWIAFGSPVAMKASVGEAEGQLLYLGTGYTDSDPLNQCWKNVSGFPDTGKNTADLAADSPYLLAAEEAPTPVSFAAEASPGQPVEIPATATVTLGVDLPNGQFLFRTNPNLANLTLSNIYVLNAEGTLFELQTGSYQVKPFEAYITANAVTCSRIRSLKIGDNIATGIDRPIATTTRIWGTRGTLHISADAPADVLIVTPAGRTLRSLKASAGETTLALPSGIYFVRCNGITYKVSL